MHLLHFAIICDFIRNSCQVRLKIALQKNQELKTLKSQAPERLSVIHKIVGDYVIFASSSGVRAFFDSEKAIPKNAKIVCIGDITAQAVRQHGINDFRISKTSNIEGIIETIINAEEENETIKKAQSE